MKKIFCVLPILLFSFFCIAQQFPVRPAATGSTSTMVAHNEAHSFKRGIVIFNAVDTAALNSVLYLKNEPFIIASTNGGIIWQRDSLALRWVRIAGVSGGTGGGISKVGSPAYGLTRINDSTYIVDTTVAVSKTYVNSKDALKLNIADTAGKWVGAVERKTDSIIIYKGVSRNAYYVPSSTGTTDSPTVFKYPLRVLPKEISGAVLDTAYLSTTYTDSIANALISDSVRGFIRFSGTGDSTIYGDLALRDSVSIFSGITNFQAANDGFTETGFRRYIDGKEVFVGIDGGNNRSVMYDYTDNDNYNIITSSEMVKVAGGYQRKISLLEDSSISITDHVIGSKGLRGNIVYPNKDAATYSQMYDLSVTLDSARAYADSVAALGGDTLNLAGTYLVAADSSTIRFDSSKVMTNLTKNATGDSFYVWKGEVITIRLKDSIGSGSGAGMAIGGAITSATAGRILFPGTSGRLQQSANFFYDSTNARLGIGGTPSYALHIRKNTNGLERFILSNTNAGTGSSTMLQLNSDVAALQFGSLSSGYTTSGVFTPGALYMQSNAASKLMFKILGSVAYPSPPITFVKNYGSDIEMWRMTFDNESFTNTGVNGTAAIHLKASTSAAGTGQIKLTPGVRLSTPEDGNLNYISSTNNLEFTAGSTLYAIAKTLTNTATLDFPSVASLGQQTLTITVTGASSGDVLNIGIPAGSMTAGLVFTYWVSGTNTVSIQCYNSTLGAIDPASGTFRASIIKY